MTIHSWTSALVLVSALSCNAAAPAPSAPAPKTTLLPESPRASAEPPRHAAETMPAVCPRRRFIGDASLTADGRSLLTTCAGSFKVCGEGADEAGTRTDDHFVDVWELDRGELARSLDTGLSNVSMRFSPNHLLATVADPTTGTGEVRVFDTTSWKLLAQTEAYCIQSVLFDDKGARLAIAGADGQIHAFDTSNWQLTSRPMKDAHPGGDVSVGLTFDPTGKTLFVMDESGGPQVVDAATLAKKGSKTVSQQITSVAVSPKADWAAVVMNDGAIDVIDTRTLLAKHKTKADPLIGAVVYAVDSDRFITVAQTGEMAVWNARGTGPGIAVGGASRPDASPKTTAFDPAKTTFAVANTHGEIHLWDVKTFSNDRQIALGGESATPPQMTFNPAGTQLAVCDELGRVGVWDIAKARKVAELPPIGALLPDDAGPSLDWTADGAFVIEAANGEVRVLRLADGETITLTVFEDQGKRFGLVRAKDGTFAGSRDLAACAAGSAERIGTNRQSLLADFVRGRPIH